MPQILQNFEFWADVPGGSLVQERIQAQVSEKSTMACRFSQVRHLYPSLAICAVCMLRSVFCLYVRLRGLWLSRALACDLLTRRLKLGFRKVHC